MKTLPLTNLWEISYCLKKASRMSKEKHANTRKSRNENIIDLIARNMPLQVAREQWHLCARYTGCSDISLP